MNTKMCKQTEVVLLLCGHRFLGHEPLRCDNFWGYAHVTIISMKQDTV